MAQPQHSPRNCLLAALAPGDLALLQPHLEPFGLVLRQTLFEAGQGISHVTFVEAGIVSLLAETDEGRFEVGMAGPEGLVGVPVLLGVETSAHTALVQAAGEGLRLPVPPLRAAMNESASLRAVLLRYVHTFLLQVSQTAYANAGFQIEARLARWVLMTQDRTGEDELLLTHEFLAMMLGVRRSGVTVALHVLEGNGLIRATRGRVAVLNRAGLETLADDAYGRAEAEYEALVRPERAGV